MVIFIDTSALLALIDDQDACHNAAKQQWRTILESSDIPYCNNYVVLETISLVQRRFGMSKIRLLESEFLSLLDVHWIEEEVHLSAQRIFLGINRRQVSLVDCSSFDTMRRLDIHTAFTFDPHFREQGFNVIP